MVKISHIILHHVSHMPLLTSAFQEWLCINLQIAIFFFWDEKGMKKLKIGIYT